MNGAIAQLSLPTEVVRWEWKRFRQAFVYVGAQVIKRSRPRVKVVLGGGCFQNPLLVDGLERRLGGDLQVLRAIELPPGDGGLSLGQAIVADAIASAAKGG